jgi:hypothetical protein
MIWIVHELERRKFDVPTRYVFAGTEEGHYNHRSE